MNLYFTIAVCISVGTLVVLPWRRHALEAQGTKTSAANVTLDLRHQHCPDDRSTLSHVWPGSRDR